MGNKHVLLQLVGRMAAVSAFTHPEEHHLFLFLCFLTLLSVLTADSELYPVYSLPFFFSPFSPQSKVEQSIMH